MYDEDQIRNLKPIQGKGRESGRKIGNDGILKLLRGERNRKAKFISAIGYCDENGVKIFKGIVGGSIANEKKGGEGFGYDPIFIPINYKRTFAEDPDLKARISHRKREFF
ncbi:MAG: hypothetical protein B6U86_05440 [Candidatus Altiarchaeales archaeon ex4484_43]|nr:MAG: hypothetical protein B6U86_05440 [Candidatus Altiarchaeales archaeon ex4484_43]